MAQSKMMSEIGHTTPKETMFEQVRRIVEEIDTERDEIVRERRKTTPTPPLEHIDIYETTPDYRTPLFVIFLFLLLTLTGCARGTYVILPNPDIEYAKRQQEQYLYEKQLELNNPEIQNAQLERNMWIGY